MTKEANISSKIKLDPILMRGNAFLLTMFIGHAALVYIVMWSYDLTGYYRPALYDFMVYFSLGLIVFIKGSFYMFRYVSYDRDKRGVGRIKSDFQKCWLNADYLISFIIPFLFLPIFIALFSSMKSIIPILKPFYLDEFLMLADRAVHFGVDPWRITHFIFGSPFGSSFLNFFYNLWFFIMFYYTLWIVVNVDLGKKRLQYLISFIIAWPLFGSLMAVWFSSAGPVYYGNVTGDNLIFGPLMADLYSFNDQLDGSWMRLFALDVQETLWADYIKSDVNVGSGISAMPSMHLSVTTLLYLSGKQVSKFIGYGMLIFLILIQIGSVHLGWHYALDGYVSIILTWGLWKICGLVADRIYKNEETATISNL